MSVLVLPHDVFSYIHSGLKKAAYETEVTTMHSPTVYSYFKNRDIQKESKELVKQWLTMNEQSYNIRYNDSGTSSNVFHPKWIKTEPNQLLKYLICLEYNIELPTSEPMELLKNWIHDLMIGITCQNELYKNAKWSEI
jgi:hypothetical protein